ncbi:MAG: tRNA (N6-isopentenyl adenosine(37)-C2)-methylthiotransferase MiaB [Pseudomonadota bacterium]|nr:tRNA (N6-isopentenyl adenosine(37)-C2)-methylthiotransferase MiaB [Pseudomonadota bacterium]MDE3038244.1 tRNA (N6-isopentenyl adenosine(37)-C2)-methylthiotransferase MiaB [Pseudomonadota bacterium]
MTKKLYIKTYGCQMNVYDSRRMEGVLAPLGYRAQDSAEGADLVILNTCHIREKAEEKVYSDLGRVRQEKEKKSSMLIAVGGCVGQAEGEEIIRRAPFVDMVFGPQSYHQLPEMVTRAIRDNGGVVELDFAPERKFDALAESALPQGVSAFLSVQEGCDKFCSFCVVPYTRGAEYSRPLAAIEQEARRLVDQGALEITLLGQNVNAYHGDNGGSTASLADVIARLAAIHGLERIRYTTSHPRDMSDDLIAIHGTEPKLMPFLHLPVQSGSDAILKKMNRKHTAEFYLDIIARLRASRPDIAFSSDFIVGFPGETEKDFEDTLTLVEQVKYAQAYSFKYSPRPGTPAAGDEQIAEDVKDGRLQRLQALLRMQQTAFNESSVGKTMQALLDRDGKLEGQLLGKSPYMQSVHVRDAENLRGQLVDVAVTGAYLNSLAAVILSEGRKAGVEGSCAADKNFSVRRVHSG